MATPGSVSAFHEENKAIEAAANATGAAFAYDALDAENMGGFANIDPIAWLQETGVPVHLDEMAREDFMKLQMRRNHLQRRLLQLETRQRDRELEEGRVGVFYRQKFEDRLRALDRERATSTRIGEELLARIDTNLQHWNKDDETPTAEDKTLDQAKTQYFNIVRTLSEPWEASNYQRHMQQIIKYEEAIDVLRDRRKVAEIEFQKEQKVQELLGQRKAEFVQAQGTEQQLALLREQERLRLEIEQEKHLEELRRQALAAAQALASAMPVRPIPAPELAQQPKPVNRTFAAIDSSQLPNISLVNQSLPAQFPTTVLAVGSHPAEQPLVARQATVPASVPSQRPVTGTTIPPVYEQKYETPRGATSTQDSRVVPTVDGSQAKPNTSMAEVSGATMSLLSFSLSPPSATVTVPQTPATVESHSVAPLPSPLVTSGSDDRMASFIEEMKRIRQSHVVQSTAAPTVSVSDVLPVAAESGRTPTGQVTPSSAQAWLQDRQKLQQAVQQRRQDREKVRASGSETAIPALVPSTVAGTVTQVPTAQLVADDVARDLAQLRAQQTEVKHDDDIKTTQPSVQPTPEEVAVPRPVSQPAKFGRRSAGSTGPNTAAVTDTVASFVPFKTAVTSSVSAPPPVSAPAATSTSVSKPSPDLISKIRSRGLLDDEFDDSSEEPPVVATAPSSTVGATKVSENVPTATVAKNPSKGFNRLQSLVSHDDEFDF